MGRDGNDVGARKLTRVTKQDNNYSLEIQRVFILNVHL